MSRTLFWTALISASILAMALTAACSKGPAKAPEVAQKPVVVILGAYTVPKEAYQDEIIPSFVKQWKEKSGQALEIQQSYVGSGQQARAIVGGFEADIAALSLEDDVAAIQKAALITHDWKTAPHGGMITRSVVAIGVRKGNPKGIKTWEDLAKPGVEVLYPNPKTSGGAMWDVNAIYGAGLKISAAKKGAPDPAFARDLLKRIQKNVKVMDKSGRESVTTFERGIGDAIVTYENELLPRIAAGQPYEIIVPPETILIENPAALVDKYADKHGVRGVAEAFLGYLHTPEAQRAFAKKGFRPVDEAVAKEFVQGFPVPAQLFTIADLGGWEKIKADVYGEKGIWTEITRELAEGK
jgi:sulfate transport system substrate-binding protein